MSYFLDMYKRYFDFSGRSTRKEFWCAYGIWIAIYFVLYIIAILAGGLAISGGSMDMSGANVIGLLLFGLLIIFALASIIPFLAISVRRLRDAGFQWWVLLLCYVGSCLCGIGSIVLIVLWCMPTKEEENQF